jgi:hypothetical protein
MPLCFLCNGHAPTPGPSLPAHGARAAAKGHEPSIDALAHLDRKAKEAESERVAADLLRDA